MVENGVREEVGNLRERITAEKTILTTYENQVMICEDEIDFFKSAVKYHEKELERTKGTKEEEEMKERVKNTKEWLEMYEKLLKMNMEKAAKQKKRLEILEARMRELKGARSEYSKDNNTEGKKDRTRKNQLGWYIDRRKTRHQIHVARPQND